MASQPNPSPKVLFGPFEFDQLSGDLRKSGIGCASKASRSRSSRFYWSNRARFSVATNSSATFGRKLLSSIFKQGLNTAVNKLLQALGDSADQPRYIETVPGKGYRFIAPLQRTSMKPVLEMAAPVVLRIGA